MPRKAPRSTISRLARLGLAACLTLGALHAGAQESQQEHQHQHHHGDASAPDAPPPVFVASTAKSFGALMDDAMNVMDAGMKQAPMNGVSEHDFVTMMMPHHQGAVDMAKAMLLYTQDPEIRNLALGIIAEQQNEIKVMQAWLDRHATSEKP
jgi:uncharacterized protein (DUF305 family)